VSSQIPDMQPDPEDVLQVEPDRVLASSSVPVAVDGPVRVQTLPASPQWAVFRQTIDQNTPQQLLGADPRRKRAVIMGEGSFGFFLGNDRSGINAGRVFRSTVNIPLEFTHTGEIWALGDGGSTILSVYLEQWTD
jgi:hypothetical protein